MSTVRLDRCIFLKFFYELLIPAPISFRAFLVIALIDENIVFIHGVRSLFLIETVAANRVQCL